MSVLLTVWFERDCLETGSDQVLQQNDVIVLIDIVAGGSFQRLQTIFQQCFVPCRDEITVHYAFPVKGIDL